MGAIKRKAEQGAAPSKKPKGASTDRSAKRRKSDAEQPSPAKSKPESAAPKPSVFKDEEKSFPRGGASVLTPLEHKQIQIKANQDVLFEQSGEKRTGGGDDGFSDMGSEDEEKNAAKSKKKPLFKKSKKSHDSGEKDDTVRAEGLSYKVRQSLRIASVMLTIAETVAWDHHPRPSHRRLPPGHCARAPE
jgi:rRNA biogenesis protein RRP5